MVSIAITVSQITRATDWLKGNFAQPLRIKELATRVTMRTTTFHHHFRSMTALSPLQLQKQLRLREARRLMLMEHLGRPALHTRPAQFSREYSRLFGAPPLRDIATLRRIAVGE